MSVRVLVTGGAGFVGSHVCDALIARGEDVTILDNLSTGSQKNIQHLIGKVRVVHDDIRNIKIVESLVEESDLILHLAAAVGVYNILKNPIESISINYQGSEVVLNAAANFSKRIFIASTSEIYGKNPNQPLSETDDRVIGAPQKIRWSYADAKALEEALAYSLFLNNGLKVTTLRLFNTVGPRQTGKYGMVIPNFVEAALKNNPLTVFGDGNQSRVFCHIEDTIKAIFLLISNDNSIGEVFNIGGTSEITILNLAKLIITKTNSNSKIQFINYRDAYDLGFEEMLRRVPNISKIRKSTGWTPTLTIENVIDDVARSFS